MKASAAIRARASAGAGKTMRVRLLLALALVAWTAVLTRVPLTIAFPLMALSYVAIALAGVLIFKERINLRHAAGVFFVTAWARRLTTWRQPIHSSKSWPPLV